MSVSGGSVTEATISGLSPSTTYSIEVAAVNSASTGIYSDPPVIVETNPGSGFISKINVAGENAHIHAWKLGSALVLLQSLINMHTYTG